MRVVFQHKVSILSEGGLSFCPFTFEMAFFLTVWMDDVPFYAVAPCKIIHLIYVTYKSRCLLVAHRIIHLVVRICVQNVLFCVANNPASGKVTQRKTGVLARPDI